MRCVNHVDIVKCFTHSITTKRPRFQAVVAKEAVETAEVDSKAIVAATAVRRGRRNAENLRAWENKHPEDTRLVYDSRSRVGMNAQSTTIKNLLTTAIILFKTDLAFERPILNTKDKDIHQRQMMIDSAKTLKMLNIVKRLRSDDSYVRDLIAVVSVQFHLRYCPYYSPLIL